MSYDIEVWSVRGDLPTDALPKSKEWTRLEDGWQFQRENWQITVTGPEEVEFEDLPEGVAEHLPGIMYLYQLNLEPISAPLTGYELASKTAMAIGKATHGVVYDPQEASIATPRGVKRFVPERREQRFAVIEMSWWFLTPIFDNEAGTRAFIDLLKSRLPETLPRRYGLFEPPQFKLEKNGIDHFVAFLHAEAGNSAIWYPTRPCLNVSISYQPDPNYLKHLGFRSHRISLEFESTVLDQPGWTDALRRLWHDLSLFLRPFYGDVRTLDGCVRGGGTYLIDQQTERHPIRSWFWRGLPESLGHAVVLGAPYTDLWPEAALAGRQEQNLCFLDSLEWRKSFTVPIEVPSDLRQSTEQSGWQAGTTDIKKYPVLWPFNNLV